MSMIEAAAIKRMSPTKRLQTMELLWDSLSASPEQIESPSWHGEILSARLAKVAAGKGKFLSLAEVKSRLGKRRG